jgi:hypothetical protein
MELKSRTLPNGNVGEAQELDEEPWNGNGAATTAPLAPPITPIPLFRPASGLYVWNPFVIPIPGPVPIPIPGPVPIPQPIPGSHAEMPAGPSPTFEPEPLIAALREELRLDVDGRYPQMTASGTILSGLVTQIHWIARLAAAGSDTWSGTIWYKDGNVAAFPYTGVTIKVTRAFLPGQMSAIVTFSGGGPGGRTRAYRYQSPYYHEVEFEFDCAEGTTAVTQIETHAHPNHPATIPAETLSLEKVYQRAGFRVSKSGGDTTIPMIDAGANALWSDLEMHDAMQKYWSRFANKAQWSLWTFFAALHETGNSLGGVMFDDIGPNHRQGTAIFEDAFIKVPPVGDPAPAAWVSRMRFWTAAHEMGHAFNLAHSWQKSLGTPWIPLADEPEARSFMNYPYNVAGGQTGFFSNFEYRFTNQELLFMRHAPARFVQMGNAAWFDHHGFQQANVSPEPRLQLEVRVNRSQPQYEFLEPVMVELKLTNVSAEPQLIPDRLLVMRDQMTVIVKRDGQEAKEFLPHVQYCWRSGVKVLLPGESVYEGMFVSAGRNGWTIAEPGYYTVQIALHLEQEDLVSKPLRLRVTPPRGYEEEYLAQDYFSEEVGRILRFDGSRFLEGGNNTLREVVERLPERSAALHARLALGNAVSRPYKELVLKNGESAPSSLAGADAEIRGRKPEPREARAKLSEALTDRSEEAARTFGHVYYKRYMDNFSNWLAQHEGRQAAAKVQDDLYSTLSGREVNGRKVLSSVLKEVEMQRADYKKK